MSYTRNTLKSIIRESFEDKQSKIVETSGIPKSTISRILAGTLNLSPDNLSTICDNLTPEDARSLCLATCRDILPDHIAPELNISTNDSLKEDETQYGLLDPETETIFQKLKALCAKDPEMLQWLHSTAKWIFPKD